MVEMRFIRQRIVCQLMLRIASLSALAGPCHFYLGNQQHDICIPAWTPFCTL